MHYHFGCWNMTMVFQWKRSWWNLIDEQPSFYSIILSFQLRLQRWVLGIYRFLTSVFDEIHQAVKTGWIFTSLNGKYRSWAQSIARRIQNYWEDTKKKTTFLAKQSGHKHLESNAHATRRNIPCSKPTNPINILILKNPVECEASMRYFNLQASFPHPFNRIRSHRAIFHLHTVGKATHSWTPHNSKI